MTGLGRFCRGAASEGGQAIVVIAVLLLGMLMSVGLAIDAGQLYSARRTAQEAADSGAYAGAVVLYQSGDLSAAGQLNAANAATADAARNGFSGDCLLGAPIKVCVNAPPLDGPHVADVHYVEVWITEQVRTEIVPRSGLTTVHVRAVAGAAPLNSSYALIALDRGNTADALYVGSQGTVKIDGAGILVNSTSPTAAYDQVTTQPPPNVTITNSPTGTQVAGGTSGGWPNATTGSPQRPDPFAGYPKPSTTGLATYSSLPAPVNGAVTLDPGIYTVPITFAGNTAVTLNSGVYIVKAGMNGGGNLDLVSAAGGVFIFNTVADYPTDSGGGCGNVELTGNTKTNVQPLTSGIYAHLLYYQDPSCTQTFTIAGNGTLLAGGTIYAPNAPVVLDGNNATLDGSQVVAKTINVQNGNVTINFDSAATAQPVLPRLAE